MAEKRNPTEHRMTRRSQDNNYSQPGMYHVTLRVAEGMGRPFGRVAGDARLPDGSEGAPHVELTPVGRMVEQELLNSIRTHYKMVEVQDYVVMPEHLHFILEVHAPLVSAQGRPAHLGQVIAGFKKGCNRRFWELTGQTDTRRGKPAGTDGGGSGADGGGNGGGGSCPAVSPQGASPVSPQEASPVSSQGASPVSPQGASPVSPQGASPVSPQEASPVSPQGASLVSPQGYKVPSRASSGRAVLFAAGYVDVMPLRSGQLAQQRQYIRNNPRSRLLRSTHRDVLQPQRGGIDTALTVNGLWKYLRDVCAPWQLTPAVMAQIESRLLMANDDTRRGKPAGTDGGGGGASDGNGRSGGSSGSDRSDTSGGSGASGKIGCDSYGNRVLLQRRLLPVVCHGQDQELFARQKAECLKAARQGAVLVSARIAPGEQEIIDAALEGGLPVVLVTDNGMPEIFHPSETRMAQCLADQLLIVTPWRYHYRSAEEGISVAICKTMNCVAQAICRQRDDWWKTTGAG